VSGALELSVAAATSAGDLEAAARLFDRPLDEEASRRFLGDERHHLLVARVGAEVVGFVSGVEMTHPDKGTELFVYELAVAEAWRRRGIGTALLRELSLVGRSRGCYGMWVLAEAENEAAVGLYRAFGAAGTDSVMFAWEFVA